MESEVYLHLDDCKYYDVISKKHKNVNEELAQSSHLKEIGIIYYSLTFGFGFASLLNNAITNRDLYKAPKLIENIILIVMLMTSNIIILGLIKYMYVNRNNIYENVTSENKDTFEVHYSVQGQHMNIYLKIAIVLFAGLSLCYNVLDIISSFMVDQKCRFIHDIIMQIIMALFFILQALLILFYPTVVFLRHLNIIGGCLVHLMSTNIFIWAYAIIKKISAPLPQAHYKTSTCPNQFSLDLQQLYLLPPMTEYTIVASVFYFSKYEKMGQPTAIFPEHDHDHDEHDHHIHNPFDKANTNSSERTYIGELLMEDAVYVSNQSLFNLAKIKAAGLYIKRKIGFALNILFTLSSFVILIVVLYCYYGKSSKSKKYSISKNNTGSNRSAATSGQNNCDWRYYVHDSEEFILNLIGLGLCIYILKCSSALEEGCCSQQLDRLLLYIAFFFTIFYQVASTQGIFDYFNSENLSPPKKAKYLKRGLINLLEFFQIIIQTYTINDGFYRYSGSPLHQILKPGSQAITTLMGVNLALWIIRSFQSKSSDIFIYYDMQESAQIKDFGTFVTKVFLYATMPMSMLYRYHSTVCLSEFHETMYHKEELLFDHFIRLEDTKGMATCSCSAKSLGNRPRQSVSMMNTPVTSRRSVINMEQFQNLGRRSQMQRPMSAPPEYSRFSS